MSNHSSPPILFEDVPEFQATIKMDPFCFLLFITLFVFFNFNKENCLCPNANLPPVTQRQLCEVQRLRTTKGEAWFCFSVNLLQ